MIHVIHWIQDGEGLQAKMPCDISLIFKCVLCTCDSFFFGGGGGCRGNILLTFSLQFSLYLAEITFKIIQKTSTFLVVSLVTHHGLTQQNNVFLSPNNEETLKAIAGHICG